jgi:uncharacterized glyoxalase superfamily protein PhnB
MTTGRRGQKICLPLSKRCVAQQSAGTKPSPASASLVTASERPTVRFTRRTTHLHTKKALEFYKKAFGAEVIDSFPNLNGKGIMHAVMKIGDSLIMMGDEMGPMSKSAETMAGCPMSLFIYVPDVDKLFPQTVAAGATVVLPLTDMFWGDRAASLKDPFGYEWMIATYKQDLSKDQIKKNAEKFFAEMAKK